MTQHLTRRERRLLEKLTHIKFLVAWKRQRKLDAVYYAEQRFRSCTTFIQCTPYKVIHVPIEEVADANILHIHSQS